MKTIIIIIIYLLVSTTLMTVVFDKQEGHQCSFIRCPYKGIHEHDWKEKIIEECDCEEGSDEYEIDLLHLEYPKKTNEELEDMLFKTNYTV